MNGEVVPDMFKPVQRYSRIEITKGANGCVHKVGLPSGSLAKRRLAAKKLPAKSIFSDACAGYNSGVNDDGFGGADIAGVVFLVLAAMFFAWGWYKRAFQLRFDAAEDEEASRGLLAAPESKIASRSVTEPRNLSPAGHRVLITVFCIMAALMVASPIVTALVAEKSYKHASRGYSYPDPTLQKTH